jgi:hypothetical protein
MRASAAVTLVLGRGALETSRTTPPLARNVWQARTALANGATPLCITPQMSTNHADDDPASGAIEVIISQGLDPALSVIPLRLG